MPYLGRAPTGTGSVTEIIGDLKVTGQLTAGDNLFKMVMDTAANEFDNILIEDGGTDGSGTNAGDDICLEKHTEGVSDISSIASAILSPANTGRVKEVVPLVCNGSSVTVESGTYTSVNVTATYNSTSSYADLTGSKLTYTPPAGTTTVIYEFSFGYGYVDATAHFHLKFFIAGAEVVHGRRLTTGYSHTGSVVPYRWVIQIGGDENANTGQLSSWTSRKELNMQFRDYSASLQGKMHGTTYWDGTGGNQLMVPTLTITSLG